MLLSISTTHQPATDLGFLLHKNPSRIHQKDLPFGTAHVVYPDVGEDRCTAALLVDIDPIKLVRKPKSAKGRHVTLAAYVNDRPYAASSFLSVAMGRLFNTALGGKSKERPELATTPIPLTAHLPVLPVRGGEPVLRKLFEPLGYEITSTPVALDETFPDWGDSRYLDVRLSSTVRLQSLLEHLFILLPVLDDDKHYWVGGDEVDKLLRLAGEWLRVHPERELITRRYLRHDRRLTSDALARLLADDDTSPDTVASDQEEETEVERPISLNEHRMAAVLDQIEQAGARRVVDLGCGGGDLLKRILRDTKVTEALGVDVSHRALEVASRRLRIDTMAPRQRERIGLMQGALTYRDRRLRGFDLATVVEVIEHLDVPRLAAFERALFGHARPGVVVVTTPNIEYNELFETLPNGSLRHRDHRFEWTRAEFAAWAAGVAERNGYAVDHAGIGSADPDRGAPTQMAVFRR